MRIEFNESWYISGEKKPTVRMVFGGYLENGRKSCLMTINQLANVFCNLHISHILSQFSLANMEYKDIFHHAITTTYRFTLPPLPLPPSVAVTGTYVLVDENNSNVLSTGKLGKGFFNGGKRSL